jgi:hypothetical protein
MNLEVQARAMKRVGSQALYSLEKLRKGEDLERKWQEREERLFKKRKEDRLEIQEKNAMLRESLKLKKEGFQTKQQAERNR